MKKSSRHMRRIILDRLYTHLREYYSIDPPDDLLSGDQASLQQIDSMLAFKSDPLLDELRSALDRLEEGTLGVCLRCKNAIDARLMDADPTRRFCERCERAYSHVAWDYRGSALPV